MQYPGNLHKQYVYGNQANDPNTEMTILSNTIKGNTHDHMVLNQSASPTELFYCLGLGSHQQFNGSCLHALVKL